MKGPVGTMSLPAESKTKVLVLLLAWPGVVAVGWAVALLTGTHWPIGLAAVGWLGVVYWTLRHFNSNDPMP